MKWRYSDNRLLKKLSRLLCCFGKHNDIWYDGRPLNCGVCGKEGHPLAQKKISEKIKNCIEKLKEELKD